MISLGLKSTLARTLAVFSVITLCSTSFARIELKPAKQQTAEQNVAEDEQPTAPKATESSYNAYKIVGFLVAGVVTYFGVKYYSKAPANAVNADAADGNNDGNNNAGGHLFQQLDRQHGVDNAGGGNDNGGHLFDRMRDPANRVVNQVVEQVQNVVHQVVPDATPKSPRGHRNYASPDGSPMRKQPGRGCK